MKKVHAIDEAQACPLANSFNLECIRVCKVYDWVISTVIKTIDIPIPNSCPIDILTCDPRQLIIEASLGELGYFSLSNTTGCCPLDPIERCKAVSFKRIASTPEFTLVNIAGIVPVQLSFFRNCNGNASEICFESVPVKFFDSVMLCLPESFDTKNVKCRLLEINHDTSGVVISKGSKSVVEVTLFMCLDVQVEANVTLETVGKFCRPRLPLEIPPLVCPTSVIIPPQCNFFQVSQQCQITLDVPPEVNCIPSVVTGIVSCDGLPTAGVEVILSSNSDAVRFSPNPIVTNESGQFNSLMSVSPGTLSAFIMITATAATLGATSSTTSGTLICCCEEVEITLIVPASIDCTPTSIFGLVTCNGSVVSGTTVTLTSSPPGVVTISPPTPTEFGMFTAMVTAPEGIQVDTITITAIATVCGTTNSTTSEPISVCCCESVGITLFVPESIDCTPTTIFGIVTCDGTPVSGTIVTLTSSPPGVVTISPPTPTDFGMFTATVTVPPGTLEDSITITAQATVCGMTDTTTSESISICCCENVGVTLIVPESIDCTPTTIFGIITCDGTPVSGTIVTLTSSLPGVVTISPPDPTTGPGGLFTATVTVLEGTPGTIVTFTATASVCGVTNMATSEPISVCCCENVAVTLDVPESIDCTPTTISGIVTCDGIPAPGITVTLTSSPPGVVTISPPNPTTGPGGGYTATVTVSEGTPLGTTVTFTATASVCNSLPFTITSPLVPVQCVCVCRATTSINLPGLAIGMGNFCTGCDPLNSAFTYIDVDGVFGGGTINLTSTAPITSINCSISPIFSTATITGTGTALAGSCTAGPVSFILMLNTLSLPNPPNPPINQHGYSLQVFNSMGILCYSGGTSVEPGPIFNTITDCP